MVFQLVYSSTAVQPLGPVGLVELLTQCRADNAVRRVTGVLLCREHRFLQLLEGAEAVVRDLYAVIAADARHRDVVTLSEGWRPLRQFSGWSMSFRDLVQEPMAEPGYTALFEEAVENMPGAVDAFVPRVRPSGPTGRPVVRTG